MCESGRTESATSVERIGSELEMESTFEMKAWCVSMTPFGSPVVPEV